MEINLKSLQEQDLLFVKEIYDYYTLHTTVVYFIQCVTLEELHVLVPIGNGRYRSFLIETAEEEPCGFCYYTPFKSKEAFDISVELTIYLKPEFSGHGIGQQAMKQIEPLIWQAGFKNIMALISDENQPSIRFFQQCGYECCAHIKGVAEKFEKRLDLKMFQKQKESSRSRSRRLMRLFSRQGNYTQKEMDCEFANRKLRVRSVSNSFLYCGIFSKKILTASLNFSFVR